jgi:hypothetical protein
MPIARLKRNIILVCLCAACGGPLKYHVTSSPQAPGADADIVAHVNEEQNQTQLDVEISNLPPPDRVEASSQHYVAWYRRDSKVTWSRVAALAYEPDSREAKLIGSVPEKSFELSITAEPDAAAVSPSPSVVFAQAIGE